MDWVPKCDECLSCSITTCTVNFRRQHEPSREICHPALRQVKWALWGRSSEEVPICKRKATGSHTADKSCAPRAYETGGVPSGACLGPQLSPIQKLPSPSDWGWIVSADELWIPFWTALPEAAKSCKELVKCQCKKACRASCKCVKSSLTCTELCFCGGTCYRAE